MILGEIIVSEPFLADERIKTLSEKPIIRVKTELEVNPELPTIIVGWALTKELFPDKQVNILEKKIGDNLFWTFSPKEDKQYCYENIDTFIDKLYDDFVSKVKYEFIDPMFLKLSHSDCITKLVKNGKYDNTYFTEDFIYMYNKSVNVIYGIDLKYMNFLRYDRNEIAQLIKNHTSEVLVEDYTAEGSVYQKYKNYLNKDFDKKFIVLIINSQKKELF